MLLQGPCVAGNPCPEPAGLALVSQARLPGRRKCGKKFEKRGKEQFFNLFLEKQGTVKIKSASGWR